MNTETNNHNDFYKLSTPEHSEQAPPKCNKVQQAPMIPTIKKSVKGIDLIIALPILWAMEMFLAVCLIFGSGFSFSPVENPELVLLITLISGAFTLLVSWYLVCKKYNKSLADGFNITKPTKKMVLTSISIALGYSLFASIIIQLFSTDQSMMTQVMSTTKGLICMMILGLLIPFIEEIYYRGFIFPVLRKRFGSIPSIIVVSIWFAGVHALQLAKDPIAIVIVGLAGVIWTIQRQVTQSLTPSLITHWTYNFLLLFFSLAGLIFTQ